MAKYGKKAQKEIEKKMHEFKRGKLESGLQGKGGKVRSRKQAVAIGLSEARKKGARLPAPDPPAMRGKALRAGRSSGGQAKVPKKR